MGTNVLIGTDPRAIIPALEKLFARVWNQGFIPDLWDVNTAKRFLSNLKNLYFDQ